MLLPRKFNIAVANKPKPKRIPGSSSMSHQFAVFCVWGGCCLLFGCFLTCQSRYRTTESQGLSSLLNFGGAIHYPEHKHLNLQAKFPCFDVAKVAQADTSRVAHSAHYCPRCWVRCWEPQRGLGTSRPELLDLQLLAFRKS